MKNILIIIVLMVSFIGNAQFDLSDYKYVVIPKRFDSFKKENQYRTSTLLKHLFNEKGFTTVYSDFLPNELNTNRCLALYVDLIDKSSMFTTKTILVLRDCEEKEVMQSSEGRSKEKDYETSYKEAINIAFSSFEGLNYSYKSNADDKPITISFKNDIKTVEEKPVQEGVQKDAMVTQVATTETQSYKDNSPVASNYKKAGDTKKKTVTEIATKEEQSFKSNEPISSEVNKEDVGLLNKTTDKSISGVLYAQELPNGFQLVDSMPKIQLKIYKSAMPNVYLAKGDDKDGLVYTSDGKWFFEYYNDDSIVVEELTIKF